MRETQPIVKIKEGTRLDIITRAKLLACVTHLLFMKC